MMDQAFQAYQAHIQAAHTSMQALRDACPVDMFQRLNTWALWMHEHGGGSVRSMTDYAMRRIMWRDVNQDDSVSDSVKAVVRYMLNIGDDEE